MIMLWLGTALPVYAIVRHCFALAMYVLYAE